MKTSQKILLLFAFVVLGFGLKSSAAEAASRYWVGGGAFTSWIATGNTNWAETSGGANNASVPGSADDVFFDGNSGTGDSVVSSAHTVKSLNATGYTGTLTQTNITLTVAGSVTLVSGMTYTPSVNAIIALSATGTFTTGGKLINQLTLSAGTTTLGDNLSFRASKGISLTLNGNFLDLNGKTVSGNSTANRLIIQSNLLGTARTITINGGTFANADFSDTTPSVATDISAITGGSGDAGGNSADWTFTTAQTNYWIGDTGSWSDSTQWSTSSGGAANGRVPLPQDNVTFDNGSFSGTSQTVTLDMIRAGKSIDWSGYSEGQTPTFLISAGTASLFYGSLTLVSGMTFTMFQAISFNGRGAFEFTTAGKTFTINITVAMFGGTLTMQDAFSSSSSFTLTNGTLNANNFNVTATTFSSSNSNTRTLTMGSGTWTVTSSGTVWNMATATNLTVNADTSTISMTEVTTAAKTFAGGGKTFNNISIASDGSAGTTTFTGANTFAGMTIGAGGAKSIVLPGSTTTTITASSGLGNGTNVVTFTASSGSATISSATGNFCWNYVSLTNIPSTGGATFYAGANSTNGGGNTGWSFTACPSGAAGFSKGTFESKGDSTIKGDGAVK